MRWRTGLDLDLAGLLGCLNNGLEMVSEFPFGFRRGVARFGAGGLWLPRKRGRCWTARAGSRISRLSMMRYRARLSFAQRSTSWPCIRDRLPDLGEQAGCVQGVFDSRAAEDFEGFAAGVEGFGVGLAVSGAEQRLGVLELAGLHQGQRFEHDWVPGGEGGGSGRRLGGKLGPSEAMIIRLKPAGSRAEEFILMRVEYISIRRAANMPPAARGSRKWRRLTGHGSGGGHPRQRTAQRASLSTCVRWPTLGGCSIR